MSDPVTQSVSKHPSKELAPAEKGTSGGKKETGEHYNAVTAGHLDSNCIFQHRHMHGDLQVAALLPVDSSLHPLQYGISKFQLCLWREKIIFIQIIQHSEISPLHQEVCLAHQTLPYLCFSNPARKRSQISTQYNSGMSQRAFSHFSSLIGGH